MVLFAVDIPLTLVLIGIGVGLSLIGVVWLTLNFMRIGRLVKHFMANVPVLAPEDLKDLEERAEAINAFNNGDAEALKRYWKNIYEKRGEKKDDKE